MIFGIYSNGNIYDLLLASFARKATVTFLVYLSVTFGGHELEVRPTPGHTNGCVTFVCHNEKLAFTGKNNVDKFNSD